ncbi:hypothetical protein BsWGS_05212 [Bradybaena similaris]
MRLTLQRVLRNVLGTSFALFVVLNMHVLYKTPDLYSSQKLELTDLPAEGTGGSLHVQRSISQLSTALTSNLFNETVNQTELVQNRYQKIIPANNIEALKQEIIRINKEQVIHNLDKYQLNLSMNGLVFVIQVHDRVDYLRTVVDSMRKVQGIENSLIVVSHDVYSDQLNEVVNSVEFCPVMQIFFPFSQQVYSHEFPGEDPNDCPRNVKKDEAIVKKCNNAEHPDKYGHYREAKYCQAKHHWMWKLYHLFEEIHVLKDYEGDVMILEDDYYLSGDIIASLQKLKELRKRECLDCRMLVLGNYEKNQNYPVNGAKAERAYWISSKHNMGMTFNRSLWLEIKKCAKQFCEFDDYNWDWTLMHLSMTCIPEKVRILVMKATRIFHIGECGMHTKSSNCDPVKKVKEAETKLQENQQHLYPDAISLAGDSRFKLQDPKPNGGWGDIRDHRLCQHYFNATATR